MESKQYDKIFKENVEQIFLALCEKHLNIKIRKTEELKDKLQTTTEREADFLKMVYAKTKKKFILHIEFQTQDETNMILRMQEYHGILKKKYNNIDIEQIVVYLDDKPSKMVTQLPDDQVFRGFKLLSLHTLDYQTFLDSQIPEEVMLAILCDFEQENAKDVLKKIILTLQKISKDDITLKKYIRQILLLSRLRQLTSIFHETIENDMAITLGIDIKNDVLYKQGIEEGKFEGKLEGKLEGEIEGELKTNLKIALNAIKKGFDSQTISELTGLSMEEIEKLRKKK